MAEKMLEIIRNTITKFCLEFVRNPYLCYTEHGQHALFYSMLFNALPEQQRYLTWQSQKVCVLQKEYPTAGNLGKPQRQHWDIAVLKNPPESLASKSSYDYLKVFAAIEFGMNEAKDHLEDDIARLCHPEANLEHGFIVHLYRLSESSNLFSGRDWSAKSGQVLKPEKVMKILDRRPVEIFYGLVDSTRVYKAGIWNVKDNVIEQIPL
jgi:hypothetical protein